jgi:hypothetical protein
MIYPVCHSYHTIMKICIGRFSQSAVKVCIKICRKRMVSKVIFRKLPKHDILILAVIRQKNESVGGQCHCNLSIRLYILQIIA